MPNCRKLAEIYEKLKKTTFQEFHDKIKQKKGIFMRKILVFLFMIFTFANPVFADNHKILPSETGIVLEAVNVYNDENENPTTNQIITVKILTGDFKNQTRDLINMLTDNPAYSIPLKKGDKVILHLEDDESNLNFYIADIKRDNALIFFAGLFCVILVAIGRKKGIFSLISIIATVGLIFTVLIPIILTGFCPIIAALLVGILSTIITIYLVGGFNAKSTSAILGTSISLIFAGILSALTIIFAKLTGFAGEENMFLYSVRPDLSFKGILVASMIIAALGALMDTAVSIASTINEIHETDNSLSIMQLFKSGMNVGKDVIGTMSNTLILVYLGASLPLVLLANNIDLQKFFNLNQVATEILSALVGSIAILACVPITAILSAYMIKKKKTNPEFKF